MQDRNDGESRESVAAFAQSKVIEQRSVGNVTEFNTLRAMKETVLLKLGNELRKL